MKNKRNVLIAFILICALCLSIGYAALADDLYVNGTVSVDVISDPTDPSDPYTPFEDEFMKHIYFKSTTPATGVTATIVSESDTAEDDNGDKDKLTITVPAGVLVPGSMSTTVEAVIVNDGTMYNAKILDNGVTITQPTSGDYTVSWKWADNSTGALAKNGGTSTMLITITLNDAPTTDITNETFSITINAVVDEG